jgi:hypothetical protein
MGVNLFTYQPVELGAGEGNRTLVLSLEGFSSTIELRPHISNGRTKPKKAQCFQIFLVDEVGFEPT